jgi:hypothetical protein
MPEPTNPQVDDEGVLFDSDFSLALTNYRITAKVQNASTLVEAYVDGAVVLDGLVENLYGAEAQAKVADDIQAYAKVLADRLLAVLPDAGIGVASVHQVPAAAGAAAPSGAPAAGSAPVTGENAQKVTNRFGTDIYTMSIEAFSSQQLQDEAIKRVCTKFKFDESHLVAFDDRPEYRRGHVGNVQFRKDSPGHAVLGGKALAWIDFNADGSLKLSATKDFKDIVLVDVDLQLALRSPFDGASAAPSAAGDEEAF